MLTEQDDARPEEASSFSFSPVLPSGFDAREAEAVMEQKIGQAAAKTQAAKVRLETERMAQGAAQQRLAALQRELQAEIDAGREIRRQAGETRRSRLAAEYQVFQQVRRLLSKRFVVAFFLLAFVLLAMGFLVGLYFGGQQGHSSVSCTSQQGDLSPPIYSSEGESEHLAGGGPKLRLDDRAENAFPGSHSAGTDGE